MSYCKYKDASPEQTITTIKKCFKSVGIEFEERIIMRMEGIYSSMIIDSKTGWAAAGKGTSKEYCLASGYAEAMEHFCNYCAYDTSLLDNEANNYLNFVRYPDEKRVDISHLGELYHVYDDIKDSFSMEGDKFSEEKAVKAWTDFLKTDKLTLVPYYSVKEKRIVYLPEAVLGKLCGSTGGGAGNTPEEALGHALDEISERYVKYIIYSQELTPPDISRDFIKTHCPELYRIIMMIESKERYKILVKDASLGRGYPVLVVCLIDQEEHSYIANFGAHPIFTIALERCLTEMFQFMELDGEKSTRHKNMKKWSSYETEGHSIRNWTSLLRDDTGVIPDSFFVGKNSWTFIPWGIQGAYNNWIGMKKQIENFLRNNVKDIFIRNFSFLGFPVYRIYIPEVSYSHFTVNDRIMNMFANTSSIVENLLNDSCCTLEKDEIELLKQAFSKESYISTWILRSLNENYIDFLYASLIKQTMGEKEALLYLSKIDESFAQAIIEDRNMAKKGKSQKDRKKIIGLFYSEFEMEMVKAWCDENAFVKLLKLYKKYKLIKTRENHKYIEQVNLVHKRVKEKMCEYLPSQMNIEKIVNIEYTDAKKNNRKESSTNGN